jgi:hypothetical protein
LNEEEAMRLTRISLAIVVAATLGGCRSTTRQLEPTPPERTDMPRISRPIPPREPVPGSNARTALLFTQAIPGLGAHMEVREYYISQGNELSITSPNEGVFEVRSGKFNIDAPGVKGEHSAGTTWTAAPDERVVVRTTSELAILRATYIVRER